MTYLLAMFSECKKLCFLTLFVLPAWAFAQNEAPIPFINPSFEDVPKPGKTPNGWYNCGWPETQETPPDIQPGTFQVAVPPSDGNTYMGLVVRDNETYESVGQRLSRPILQNECYEFSLELCRSELYVSQSKATGQEANYVTPAKLRVWGGNGYCDRAELLYETPLVTNFRWITYSVRMHPIKGNYAYIILEAYYKTPILFPYNGHILVDKATPIKHIPCNPEKMPEPKPKVTAKAPTTPPSAKPTAPPVKKTEPTVAKKSEPEQPVAKIERANVKKGKVFRLEKVYFDANKFEIKPESEPELSALFKFLRENPDVVVEVGGHTNNAMWPNENFATELSTNRAKAVADWLTNKGIQHSRVQFKGYGWKYPIEPNTTEAGKRKNQRVEVKILTFNG